MLTQKKVHAVLMSCLALCLILLLLITLILPIMSKNLGERLNLQEGNANNRTAKKLHNNWILRDILRRILNFVYLLWPILASLAYIRGYLSKNGLILNVSGPWFFALFSHLFFYVKIPFYMDTQIIHYFISSLLQGLLGALLVLGFIPKQKPRVHALKGEIDT